MKSIYSLLCLLAVCFSLEAQHIFSVRGSKTYLNEREIQVIGLRCSNSLMTEESTDDLIKHLDLYNSYGINTVSVFFMGSRFGDVKGYNGDASLNPVYAKRMARIIEACDQRDMVVLVGCLYWGNSKGKWDSWGQQEAEKALANTVRWLSENNYRNVFVDPDNEGMAHREKGFDIAAMIAAGKEIDPSIMIGFNSKGYPPHNADLALHFSERVVGMPYVESEGTMTDYWGAYSKEKDLYNYINVGIYTPGKKAEQLKNTDNLLQQGHGYLFASTWLQHVPPSHHPGGDGTPCDPGIRWWLEYIRENYLQDDR
jgi:hypothetical protein